jgi:DNA polymerase-3 subunit gamma/tau
LEDLTQHLAYIAEQEGVQAERAALEYIARQGGGSMRDAISLLDQLVAYGSGQITLELVQRVLGAVTSQSVVALVEAIIERDMAAGLDVINQVVSDGVDPRQMAREMVDYLRGVMLVKLGDGAELLNVPTETLAVMQTQAARVEAGTIVQATALFNKAMLDIKSGLLTIPQLPLELAFVETATAAGPILLSAPTVSGGTTSGPIRQSESKVRAEQLSETIPAPTVVPAPVDELTIDTIRTCFEQVMLKVEKKNKYMAEALRTQARLYKVAGNDVYFTTVDMMKRRFEKPQPKTALNEAFSEVLGQPVSVHFLSETASSEAQSLKQGDNEDEIAALLKVAKELGGQIVD